MENLLTVDNINYFLVFMEGLLSFFSPCILPLIPVYISYLAGNGKEIDKEGNVTYERKTVLFNTIFFVLGISFAFFILGMSFSALGNFFNTNKEIIIKISGIIIIFMGLVQLGVFRIKFFQREYRIHTKFNLKNMNFFMAFLLGFTFSFAWTPCIGPALASVLLLASSSTSVIIGNLLVLLYTLGFTIPFLLLGFFTTQVMNFIKKNQKVFKYTIKVAAIILIIIGVMTFTGWMNGLTSYVNRISNTNSSNKTEEVETTNQLQNTAGNTSKENTTSKEEQPNAYDFNLTDQYGNTHKLSDYKGKVVFLNFWATWCPPCKEELPHVEKIYQEYGENTQNVVVLTVTNPKTDKNPYNQDISIEEIKTFAKDRNYTFPILFDETGDVLLSYYINAFPTTFMIDQEGKIYGYVQGMLEKQDMKNIISQTKQGK